VKGHSFQPGDKVIWLKDTGGGFVFPFSATVVGVTAKRVTISVHDPDERGEGIVTRSVTPARLQPQIDEEARGGKRAGSRRNKRTGKLPPAADSFEARYPTITSWVQDGWIEIGHDDCGRPFLRAMDIGGQAWEGDGPYDSLDEALRALDTGIAEWLEEMG